MDLIVLKLAYMCGSEGKVKEQWDIRLAAPQREQGEAVDKDMGVPGLEQVYGDGNFYRTLTNQGSDAYAYKHKFADQILRFN